MIDSRALGILRETEFATNKVQIGNACYRIPNDVSLVQHRFSRDCDKSRLATFKHRQTMQIAAKYPLDAFNYH